MRILISGMAGFIGMHLAQALITRGHSVTGFDNLGSITYDVSLKYGRLQHLGLGPEQSIQAGEHVSNGELSFIKGDLSDADFVRSLISAGRFDVVVNLAALAGVRLSIERPRDYFESNALGFFNLLEALRSLNTPPRLVYASSSSVYGDCERAPFREDDHDLKPVSVYAATKEINETLAATYAHLYGLDTTGLRFFTVYGPWGRPDMAPFIFTKALLGGKPLTLFNQGRLRRDFTYVEDIVQGVIRIIENRNPRGDRAAVYNIGHGSPVELMDFVTTLEKVSGVKGQLILGPMQKGDVHQTYADTTKLMRDYHYTAPTPLEEGLTLFFKWYRDYYGIAGD